MAAAAAGKEEPRSFRSLFRDIVRGMGKETREPGYAPGTLAGAAAQVLKAQGKMAEAEPLLKCVVISQLKYDLYHPLRLSEKMRQLSERNYLSNLSCLPQAGCADSRVETGRE